MEDTCGRRDLMLAVGERTPKTHYYEAQAANQSEHDRPCEMTMPMHANPWAMFIVVFKFFIVYIQFTSLTSESFARLQTEHKRTCEMTMSQAIHYVRGDFPKRGVNFETMG